MLAGVAALAGPVWAQDLLAQGLAAHKAGNHAKALQPLSQHLQKYPQPTAR